MIFYLALVRERDLLNGRIAETQQFIRRLCEDTGKPLPPELQRNPAGRAGSGLTEHVREVFRHNFLVSAADVHCALVGAGTLDVSKYGNARSVIHNTLRRLLKQGEIVLVPDPAGNPEYMAAALKPVNTV